MSLQVVEHAAAVNKVNALEIAVSSAEQKLREGAMAVAAAEKDKVSKLLELVPAVPFLVVHQHRQFMFSA